MKRKEEIAQLLPDKAKELFFDITEERVLGASRHINMISTMFIMVGEEYVAAGKSVDDIENAVTQLSEYMLETRGKASAAIANAIGSLLKKLACFKGNSLDYSEFIKQTVSEHQENSKRNIETIIACSEKELVEYRDILLFDYSSTVARYIECGVSSEDQTLYIPESRTIGGGREFANAAAVKGIKVHFFPDAAMFYYLKRCQAAIIGAETFYPDGTAFNTTGSDLLALCCSYLHIPLYVLTPLNKVDKRALRGEKKQEVIKDLSHLYEGIFNADTAASIDFECPELLPITPEHIHAYITEAGVVRPGMLYSLI